MRSGGRERAPVEPSGRVLVLKENLVEVDAPAVPGVHMVRMR